MQQQAFSLTKATLLALGLALVTLVLVILPAEYNIDPTGLGQKMGLTVFNQQAETQAPTIKGTNQGSDNVSLTIPAGKGIEYKLHMQQYAKVQYEWLANSALYVDLHGEPQGDTTDYFESYSIATVEQMKGSFTAPFTGSHGWYWKNRSDRDVTIQLFFNGDYAIEGLK